METKPQPHSTNLDKIGQPYTKILQHLPIPSIEGCPILSKFIEPPRRIELYVLALESTTEYLHQIEQSLNINNIDRPATVKFTKDMELALKFPSKIIACTFQDWIQDYFGIETNIIKLPTKFKAATSESSH